MKREAMKQECKEAGAVLVAELGLELTHLEIGLMDLLSVKGLGGVVCYQPPAGEFHMVDVVNLTEEHLDREQMDDSDYLKFPAVTVKGLPLIGVENESLTVRLVIFLLPAPDCDRFLAHVTLAAVLNLEYVEHAVTETPGVEPQLETAI